MKKMYKNPKTDVLSVNTEHMMSGITMSDGGPGDGGMQAPARPVGDIIE